MQSRNRAGDRTVRRSSILEPGESPGGVDCGASDSPTTTQRADPADRERRVPPTLVPTGRKHMFRLMTSILTAAFVTHHCRSGPRQRPGRARTRQSESRGPRESGSYVCLDRALSPSEAASRWASKLRSSSRWGPPARPPGSWSCIRDGHGRRGQLLHPLPWGNPAEIREARHRRPPQALRRQDSAGDRPGPVDDLSNWWGPPGHGRTGYGSDRAHSYRRLERSAGPHPPSPSRRATRRASSPSSTAETWPAGWSTGVTAAAGALRGVRSWPLGKGSEL